MAIARQSESSRSEDVAPGRRRRHSSYGPGLAWLNTTPMRYPNSYVWFVFVSAMDVMLTWAILSRGGTEVNPLARAVIDRWELAGAIGFKFSLMTFVILVCEAAGRKTDWVGRWLAIMAVAISAIPVVYSLGLLIYHSFFAGEPVFDEVFYL